MSRFQIDLENYPALFEIFNEDKQEFADILKTTLDNINHAAETGRMDIAKDVYKRNYEDMIVEVMDAFFDTNGIVEKHKNKAEKEGLRGLGMNIHPLAIFTNDAAVYDAQGKRITPDLENFNLKDWLYSLFYGARFVSWQELAEYITLGEYELIDVLKARNFEQLAAIQPALQFQEDNGISKGKLIAGTGLFDGGSGASKELENCPACDSVEWNIVNSKYAYCPKCSLGGLK